MKIDEQVAPDLEKIGDLLKGANIVMMTTLDEDDRLVSRPMSLLKMDIEGALWLFSDLHSQKLNQVDRINLSLSNEEDSRYVSIAGHGEISNDRALMRELWTPFMKPWFPGGVESLDLALLKVTPQTVEYWDSTHNKMVRMFAVAASVIAGKPIGMGEHGKLSLLESP
ncbi:MAG: pyridoxamine 5'-phosphate oxidase family protein [Rhodoferax sp.]|nr:pyridoxamine 5'-phosphate oxidase family protein [Rhodoferax sp.]